MYINPHLSTLLVKVHLRISAQRTSKTQPKRGKSKKIVEGAACRCYRHKQTLRVNSPLGFEFLLPRFMIHKLCMDIILDKNNFLLYSKVENY